MKYQIKWLVLIVLLLFSITGCNKETDSKQMINDKVESSSIPDLLQSFQNEGWPKDSVPSELPEYTEGMVTNSGGEDDDYTIIVKDTNTDALERYLGELKSIGWIVTGDSEEAEAVIGLYTVNFKWNDSAFTWLQISVGSEESGSWPLDKIPPDVIMPQIGTLVGKVEILESVENMWYFNYTYDGIDENKAEKYMELLMENGWSGDTMAVSKAFEWKGELYGGYIEIYETIDTRTTFTCNFYLED